MISELVRRGLAPAKSAEVRNGIRLFPVGANAGVVTPEIVKALAEEVD